MKNLLKSKQGAGGYQFFTTEKKGNSRLSEVKQIAIIKAIEDSYSEGVYQTTDGSIKRQLLNGTATFLTLNKEDGKYYFE